VSIGGQPAEVRYAGSAPGLVAGVLQVNARIPDGVRSGAASVVLTVDRVQSRPGVTLAIQYNDVYINSQSGPGRF
jgi:trimeric autotransporter adhesin